MVLEKHMQCNISLDQKVRGQLEEKCYRSVCQIDTSAELFGREERDSELKHVKHMFFFFFLIPGKWNSPIAWNETYGHI